MNNNIDSSGRRILLVDDNPAIHQDFRKIFAPRSTAAAALAAAEAAFFGTAEESSARRSFEIDSALQGQQGVELVRKALDEKRPYGQLQVLGKHGCEFAQGYYFSRPLPALECRKLLLELAQRTSFTDTLRLQIIRPPTVG